MIDQKPWDTRGQLAYAQYISTIEREPTACFCKRKPPPLLVGEDVTVNSQRAIDFRLWAINVLKQYSVNGYVLDKEQLKNGSFLDENYFDELLQEIREIRISDIYSTSWSYNSKLPLKQEFFKTVQNKMHYATFFQVKIKIKKVHK